MIKFTCAECSKHFFDHKLPHRGEICFGCHLRTIRLGFTYGKDDFHGDTIRERQRKIVSDAAINGVEAVPVTNWM